MTLLDEHEQLNRTVVVLQVRVRNINNLKRTADKEEYGYIFISFVHVMSSKVVLNNDATASAGLEGIRRLRLQTRKRTESGISE